MCLFFTNIVLIASKFLHILINTNPEKCLEQAAAHIGSTYLSCLFPHPQHCFYPYGFIVTLLQHPFSLLENSVAEGLGSTLMKVNINLLVNGNQLRPY